MTENEQDYFDEILEKSIRLKSILLEANLEQNYNEIAWFDFLSELKSAQGNLNNLLGFLSSMMAKKYLATRFDIAVYDAASKPQGAPGLDIDVRNTNGDKIVCEIKNTVPYQKNFGANQKKEIKKDLSKLRSSNAQYKFMMVTNENAFEYLTAEYYAGIAHGIEIVNLRNSQEYTHRDEKK